MRVPNSFERRVMNQTAAFVRNGTNKISETHLTMIWKKTDDFLTPEITLRVLSA